MTDMPDIGETCEPARARRSGGRQARVALRAAPLADDVKPVRAGLPGGQYKPLTEAGVRQIHAAALDALEQIGLSQAPPSGVKLLTEAGAIQGDDGRIRFPRALAFPSPEHLPEARRMHRHRRPQRRRQDHPAAHLHGRARPR